MTFSTNPTKGFVISLIGTGTRFEEFRDIFEVWDPWNDTSMDPSFRERERQTCS